MPAWLSTFIMNYVIGYVLKFVQAAEGRIDWSGIEAKLTAEIQSLPLPGIIDDSVVKFAMSCLALVQTVLNGPLQQTILQDIVAGNFSTIIPAIKAALATPVLPTVLTAENLDKIATHAALSKAGLPSSLSA